ncbi:MAG: hypothetical protein WBD40_25405 [Tepidisphaeraceae bacterium]
MSWILLGGAVVCGWAMLRTMGSERERRVMEQRHAATPQPPAAAPPAPVTKSSAPKRPSRKAA